MSALEIRAAHKNDEGAVRSLLSECGLPVDGIEFAFPAGFVVTGAIRIIGCAGIELYDNVGLLRSVAVERASRGKGIGRDLVAERIAEARKLGLQGLYALTTSAPVFLAQQGFVPIDRNAVHDSVRRSSEFGTVCPTSAAVLCHPLQS